MEAEELCQAVVEQPILLQACAEHSVCPSVQHQMKRSVSNSVLVVKEQQLMEVVLAFVIQNHEARCLRAL